jgi:hypothetical protein
MILPVKAVTTTLVQLATGYPTELADAVVCRLSASGDWIDVGITRWIDPRRILARPWNPFRLDRARSMLANGDVAPPIKVVGYRIGNGAAIYRCEDGIHRTAVARAAGRKVKALIKGYCQLRPQTLVLYGGFLWRPYPSQPECWQQVADVSADMRPLLHMLGVADFLEHRRCPTALAHTATRDLPLKSFERSKSK